MEAVRAATADDRSQLEALAESARAELAPTKGGDVWARREARDISIDGGPDRVVLVGTIDGVVVGFAASRAEALDDGAELAVLEALYVEPEAREVGVGESLLDEVMAWAEARGCIGIDGLVLPGNREAKNFFETAGMVARAIVVHRRLPRG